MIETKKRSLPTRVLSLSLMRLSLAVAAVLKTTGGKLWLKPWGHPGLSKATKSNRLSAVKTDERSRKALADAAAREPLAVSAAVSSKGATVSK